MTQRIITTAVVAAALFGATAHAQTPHAESGAKKELVQKLLQLQQPEIDLLARSLVERPAAQLMQSAATYMQQKMTVEQRDAAGKRIEADVKKYIDDATPLVRERALKLLPGSVGVAYEDKFTEAELKELVAWFSSPTNKKFQQVGAEMRGGYVQKLMVEVQPMIDPKLVTLDGKVRADLGLPPVDAANQARSSRSPASSGTATKK